MGRASSKQTQANRSTTQNIHNDGTYAGVTGTVSVDESDHSIEDSYNTEIDFEYDGDYAGVSGTVNHDESETDIDNDIDNSVDNSIEDSYNTEIDGDYYNGDVTFTDHGAVEGSLELAESVVGDALNFGESAIGEVADTAKEAITGVSETAESFGDNLATIANTQLQANESILANLESYQAESFDKVAQLAKSTSLQGQDIVAKTAEKMTGYVLGVVGLAVVVFIISGRK